MITLALTTHISHHYKEVRSGSRRRKCGECHQVVPYFFLQDPTCSFQLEMPGENICNICVPNSQGTHVSPAQYLWKVEYTFPLSIFLNHESY